MDPNIKYQVAGVLGVGGIGGVATYWLRAKVDIWRAARGAEITAAQAPMNVLLTIVQNQAKEAAELRSDLKTLMTNHLENDQKERVEHVKVLTQQTEMLKKTCDMILEDRQAFAEHRESIHERITNLAIKSGVQA